MPDVPHEGRSRVVRSRDLYDHRRELPQARLARSRAQHAYAVLPETQMIERKYPRAAILALIAGLATGAARAANDLFQKDDANPRNGFLPAADPTYVKECGACHFAYSPGLLPARSWELHLSRMEKHFGESIVLPE